jgi:hypothetical protein
MLQASICSGPDTSRTASEQAPKCRRRPASHAGAFVDSRSGLDLGYWLCLREGIRAKQAIDLKNVVYVLKNLTGREKLTKVSPAQPANPILKSRLYMHKLLCVASAVRSGGALKCSAVFCPSPVKPSL